MNKNVFSYMHMAEEFLNDARILFSAGSYRSAASRAYYSYFDAVKALLPTRSIISKSHSAARALFGNYFVKNGLFDAEDSRAFHSLFTLRQNSDYDPDELFNVEEIEKAIEVTAEFLL